MHGVVGDLDLVVLLVALADPLEDLDRLLERSAPRPCTGWKRRSRAASFSMYLRYSSSVVAPMHWSSPRDSGGLRMFAASIAPSAAPAPTSVCSSSMNRIASFVFRELLDDLLEALLELAAVLRAGDERADVQRRATRLLSRMSGTSPATMRWARPSDDGRLADAGLADQRRVVLRLPAEDLDDPLDLLLAADDRVELVGAGRLREVDAQGIDRRGLAGSLRLLGRAGGGGLRQDADHLVADLVQVHAEGLQHARGDALAFAHEAQQQVLRADVVVAEAPGLVDGQLDHPLRARREPHLADDRAIAAADDELDGGPDLRKLHVHVLEHAGGDALSLAHEAEEQVLGADVVVVEPLRLVLRQRQDLARAIRELVETIHPVEFSVVAGRPSGHPSTLTPRERHPRKSGRRTPRRGGPRAYCSSSRRRRDAAFRSRCGEGIETTRREPAGRQVRGSASSRRIRPWRQPRRPR